MGGPCPEVSNNELHLYVSLMLLEIDLLTLSLVVGLPPFINPIWFRLDFQLWVG